MRLISYANFLESEILKFKISEFVVIAEFINIKPDPGIEGLAI